MFGILNIDKPPGVTSRDMVSSVQRQIRPAKAGHAGTLDPLATGLLVICLGPATRLVPYVQQSAKQYRATFQLGRTSDSDDTEEPVQLLPDAPIPSLDQLAAAVPEFVGNIQQRPPRYSALKVAGQRAYTLARAGAEVHLEARPVRVDRIHIVSYCFPELTLEIDCGAGTYVRALGRDLAAAVGTGAVMSALTRTAIGPFQLSDAWRFSPNPAPSRSEIEHRLLPPALAVGHLAQTQVSDEEIRQLSAGRTIPRPHSEQPGEIAALDRNGQLVAILLAAEHGTLRPVRNFPAAEQTSHDGESPPRTSLHPSQPL